MKKFLTAFILFFILFFNTMNCVFAYKYRVYDPASNKTYYASIMTVGTSNPKTYNLGFYGQDFSGILVIIHPKTNKNSLGLIGGEATAFSVTDEKRLLKWRELEQNNYYEEMKAIINERKKEGMSLSQNYYSLSYFLSTLFLK